MAESYPEFFSRITGNGLLPYQERYSCDPFSPTLLIVPTGLGKSDAVIMPWLFAQASQSPHVPMRLVLVLPRQNLTVQTAKNARKRVSAAGLGERVKVLELMAGSDDNDENLRPDEPAILVSTQDLYFSRALNRGYARRPPRWPIDFALYNQDCLIVLDEIQLMDEALATSTQLAAFRKGFGTVGGAPCVWMSATVNPKWLRTVDFDIEPTQISLDAKDLAAPIVKARFHAAKSLAAAPDGCRTPAGCAAFVLENHRRGTRTLIIANTVPRAREIFQVLNKGFGEALLLHSRFRPVDRRAASDRLAPVPPEGQIVVATQVLEAGIDMTSRLLVTDLAPWGSMVQRFGRVNRYGEDADAEIYWVKDPASSKQKDPAAPYAPQQVEQAGRRLQALSSATPADLPLEDGPEPYEYVLRRADLLDLFDTTPDLSGNELDVSRFIRAGEDKDVYLAWRDWTGGGAPPEDLPELEDVELCPVSVGDFREFTKKHRCYARNFATEDWVEVGKSTPSYPGMLAVTRTSEGGYTVLEGWSPESKAAVAPVAAGSERELETDTSDRRSFQRYRQTLGAHTNRVMEKMEGLLAGRNLDERWTSALRAAAAKHDWGKAHQVFQETLHRNEGGVELLAKQCGRGTHRRKHFRHELASALAMLATGESDLAAYLAAAHHGRIRVGIRAMPGEREEDGRAVARGIWEGDTLPACELAAGVAVPTVQMSLAVMQFGAEKGSWTDRILRIRDEIGPFRLAFLEMLLRSADEAASADPGLEVTSCPSSN